MANRTRPCNNCGARLTEHEGITVNLSKYCDYKCATLFGRRYQIKDKPKRAKASERPIEHADKITQAKLNTTVKNVHTDIKQRDKGKPCISCGAPWSDDFDAGHFFAVGSKWRHSWLRFHPYNISAQCLGCNRHKSGNEAEYAIGIIDRYGVERLQTLKKLKALAHKSPPLTAQDLISIRKNTYKFPMLDD